VFNTYTVDVSWTVFSANFYWYIIVFVKVDTGVVHSEQIAAVQRHKRISKQHVLLWPIFTLTTPTRFNSTQLLSHDVVCAQQCDVTMLTMSLQLTQHLSWVSVSTKPSLIPGGEYGLKSFEFSNLDFSKFSNLSN